MVLEVHTSRVHEEVNVPGSTPEQRVTMRVVPWWRVFGRWPLSEPPGPDRLHFVGAGSSDFICGRCGTMLARSMDVGSLRQAALLCPECRRWNVL